LSVLAIQKSIFLIKLYYSLVGLKQMFRFLLLIVFLQVFNVHANESENKDIEIFYSIKRKNSRSTIITELTEYYQTLHEAPSVINQRLLKAISLLDNSCDRLKIKIVRLDFLISHNNWRSAAFSLNDLESHLKEYSCSKSDVRAAHRVIANAYLQLRNVTKARKHYLLILSYLNSEEKPEIKKATLINLGITYQIENKLDSALFFYNEAMKLDEKGVGNNRVNLFINIANLYLDMKEYDKSLFYLRKATHLNLSDFEKAFVHFYIGNNLELKGDYSGMLKNYNQSSFFAKNGNNKEVLFYVYEKLITYYSEKKQFQQAFHYKEQFDSLNAELNVINMNNLVDSLNFDNDLKIQKSKNKYIKQLLSHEAKEKKVLLVAIILSILLFSSIIFFLYKQNKRYKLLVVRQLEVLPDISHYHSNELEGQNAEVESVDHNDDLK
jgi:tetratricopeptide (TPR) repeat protein